MMENINEIKIPETDTHFSGEMDGIILSFIQYSKTGSLPDKSTAIKLGFPLNEFEKRLILKIINDQLPVDEKESLEELRKSFMPLEEIIGCVADIEDKS